MIYRNNNSAPKTDGEVAAEVSATVGVTGLSTAAVSPTVLKWSDIQEKAKAVQVVAATASTNLVKAVQTSQSFAPAKASAQKWKPLASGTALSPLTDDQLRQAKNVVSQAKSIVGMLQTALALAEAILKIVNALQSDIKNWYKPLKITAELLLEEIKKVLVSLASTGIYVLPVIPAGVGLEDLLVTVKDKVVGVSGGSTPEVPAVPLGTALSEVGRQLAASTQRTSDTLKSFNTVLSGAAFNKSDPNRPIFDNAGDIVGGAVFFLDAQADIGDLIHDIQVLLKLFGQVVDMGKLDLAPPSDLKATSVMAPKDGLDPLLNPSDSWFGDVVSGVMMNSNNYPAIKLTWSTDGVTIPLITGWFVYRLTTPVPPPKFGKDGKPEVDAQGNTVLDYSDPDFNKGDPVFTGDSYYIDFDVEPGKSYFYWVAPAMKMGGKPTAGTRVSNGAGAKVVNCIPDEQKEVGIIETPAGFLPGAPTGSPPYWKNMTVRDLLGPQIDLLYKNIYESIMRLFASAETAVDQQNDLIELLKEKLAQLQEILDTTLKIIDTLGALRLSANSMYLSVPFAAGGMKGFVDTVMHAKPPEDGSYQTVAAGSAGGGKKSDRPPPGSPCSIYAAIVVVAGMPGPDTFSDSASAIKKSAIQQSSEVVGVFARDAGQLGSAVSSSAASLAVSRENFNHPNSTNAEAKKSKSKKDPVSDESKQVLKNIMGLFSGLG